MLVTIIEEFPRLIPTTILSMVPKIALESMFSLCTCTLASLSSHSHNCLSRKQNTVFMFEINLSNRVTAGRGLVQLLRAAPSHAMFSKS